MKKFLLTAMILSAGGSAALADTINVKFDGTGQGRNVKITHGSTTHNVFSGQLKHTLSSGTGSAAIWNGSWLTFCTDVNQVVTSTSKTYQIADVSQVPAGTPMGTDKAGVIRSLYNHIGATALQSAANSDIASAFQLAVWEIVGDYNVVTGRSSLNIASGGFSAKNTDGSALSSTISNYLNSWFNAIASGSPVTGNATLVGLSSGSYQDQIISVTPPVPTPGSLALAGLGAGLLIRRRRHA